MHNIWMPVDNFYKTGTKSYPQALIFALKISRYLPWREDPRSPQPGNVCPGASLPYSSPGLFLFFYKQPIGQPLASLVYAAALECRKELAGLSLL